MDMSEKIRKLRISKNMTLEELGNKVGVGKSTVRKWETGAIANMRRDKIAKIANALDVSPAYLMGWTDEPLSAEAKIYNSYMEYAKTYQIHLKNGASSDIEPTEYGSSNEALELYQKYLNADPKIQAAVDALLSSQ